MFSHGTVSSGLDLLIRNALSMALQTGRADVVSSLEAALSASAQLGVPAFELDVLAAEVRLDGSVVPLSRGERSLLIALALQRRPATRSELIESLYPHLDPSTAASQLKVYVHRVRRRLGDPQAIVFQGESYRLGPSVTLDLFAVEASVAEAMRTKSALDAGARARLEEIRQRLLCRNLSWVADHEWCRSLERRLEALLFDATMRLGEAALAENDTAAATALAADVFELDPCDERGAELVIRAHLAVGDRVGALRGFRRYERVLKAEFAAKPSDELGALVTAL